MTIDLKISVSILMLVWSVASIAGWLIMFSVDSEAREYSGNGAVLESYFWYWLEVWFKVLIGMAAIGLVTRFCKPSE